MVPCPYTMIHAPSPVTLPFRLETHDGLSLSCKLTCPDGPGPWPVVVFVGGSGVWDSDYASTGMDGVWRPLLAIAELAERLASAKFAVVRYQKRGCTDPGGRPTQAWRTASVSNLVEDARTVLAAVEADARFSAIAVAAHSEGTQIATWAAGRDARVKALAFLGMGYRNALEIVRATRPDLALETLLQRLEQAGPEDFVLGFPAQWWREHHTSASMAEAWRDLTLPVLVQHGDADAIAPFAREALPFVAQLEAQGHPDFELVRYAGLDHFFKDADGAFRLEAVAADLARWLHARL